MIENCCRRDLQSLLSDSPMLVNEIYFHASSVFVFWFGSFLHYLYVNYIVLRWLEEFEYYVSINVLSRKIKSANEVESCELGVV